MKTVDGVVRKDRGCRSVAAEADFPFVPAMAFDRWANVAKEWEREEVALTK
jgi:hypothetical protein